MAALSPNISFAQKKSNVAKEGGKQRSHDPCRYQRLTDAIGNQPETLAPERNPLS